jgi:hypothetical protein
VLGDPYLVPVEHTGATLPVEEHRDQAAHRAGPATA